MLYLNQVQLLGNLSGNRFKFTYDKEPVIVFEEMNLKCYSKNDSAVLYNTKGVYYPMTSTW